MDRAQLRRFERDLDRQALDLARAYEALLRRLAVAAAGNVYLDPNGSSAAALGAKAAELRETVRRFAPGTGPVVVYAVTRLAHGEVLGIFWTQRTAEQWMRDHALTGSNYVVDPFAVELPHVDVAAHQRAERIARQLVEQPERDAGPIPDPEALAEAQATLHGGPSSAEFAPADPRRPMTGQPEPSAAALPGADLVTAGVSDLAAGRHTIPALLVAQASTRLRAAGVDVPAYTGPDPERAMYELLEDDDPARAYTTYNALRRRLVSFCEAAEHRARLR